MENYAHSEKKSELLWIVVKGWGCGWVKCCTGRENRKNNWGKVQNCPQNIHNLKKLQWIIKKFQKKNGGYLVNKLESYQHFVCG